jgi:hypothetical protein
MSNEQPFFNINGWTVLVVVLLLGFLVYLKQTGGKLIFNPNEGVGFVEPKPVVSKDTIVLLKKDTVYLNPDSVTKTVNPYPDSSKQKFAINNRTNIAKKFEGSWVLLTRFSNCSNDFSQKKLTNYSQVSLLHDGYSITGSGQICKFTTNSEPPTKLSNKRIIKINLKIINQESEVEGIIEEVSNRGTIKNILSIYGRADITKNRISFLGKDDNCVFQIELRKDLDNPCF